MDKDTLKQAIAEMKHEMRSRVGKKLLSIEVHAHHEDEDDEEKDPEAPQEKGGVSGDDHQSPKQKRMGMPLLG